MATVVRSVAASADDAAEVAVGAPVLTNSAPNIDGASYTHFGWRFLNITLTTADTMSSAIVNTEITSSGNDEPDILLSCEAADNASGFTTGSGNLSSRARTSATVAYQSANLGAPGFFDTPDIKACFSEVFGRGGWASGNAAAVIGTAEGSTSRDYAPSHWDAASSQEPILTITYTAAASGTTFEWNVPPSELVRGRQRVNAGHFTTSINPNDFVEPVPFDWFMGPVDLMRVRYGRREGWWCGYDGLQTDVEPDPEPQIAVPFQVATPFIIPWRAEGY